MRLMTILATATLAGVAQGDLFFIATEGEFVVTDRNGDEITGTLETTVGTQAGPFGFGSVVGGFDGELTDPGPISGILRIVSGNDDGTIVIDYDGTVFGGGATFSYAANWTVVDADGVYEGLVGSGDLSGSHFFTEPDSGILSLAIQGDLVPTPGTLGLIGLGALFAARRKRPFVD